MDLPPTKDGYNAICVFVCHLSKMARLLPCDTSLDAPGFAKLFFTSVFPHYGMPAKIVSDRGVQWNSEFWKSLCEAVGITMAMSTSYHPQTNGLVERTNSPVEASLRHYTAANQDDWSDYLPLVEFALNNAYHKALGCTPFQMNRITLPLDPFRALLANADPKDRAQSTRARWLGVSGLKDTTGTRTAIQAAEEFQWAKKCVQLAKDKMKVYHDRRVKDLHLYEEGTEVWYDLRDIRLRHPSRRGKLLPRFVGPLKILELIGRSAVRLNMPASLPVHDVVSVSMIKPFQARRANQLPPVNIDGLEESELKSILNHNIVTQKSGRNPIKTAEFLVRWKGGYEDDWLPFESFEHGMDLLEQYIGSKCTKSKRAAIFKVLTPDELCRLSQRLQKEAESLSRK